MSQWLKTRVGSRKHKCVKLLAIISVVTCATTFLIIYALALTTVASSNIDASKYLSTDGVE